MYAESVNNADVNILSIGAAGKYVNADVTTSSLYGGPTRVSGRGSTDVITWSVGGGATRVSAGWRGIDVITSAPCTASGCGNAADVITSSLAGTGGRGTIDVID